MVPPKHQNAVSERLQPLSTSGIAHNEVWPPVIPTVDLDDGLARPMQKVDAEILDRDLALHFETEEIQESLSLPLDNRRFAVLAA